ncbi:response regulator [Azospirillum sp. SYSU D00513]|uniref:response regulator n=1 Tax=Azospirillum sp. SYSU D00513 TaxID=2812561 RepID=UPI001A96BD32
MRLLLVEDNERLADLIAAGLGEAGFAVDPARTVRDAEHALSVFAYDLLLLDLGLPDQDGMALLRSLRAARNGLPVLIITARGGLDDRLSGLNGGADDYLIKPFDMAELVARCRALLRRRQDVLTLSLEAGNVALDTATLQVTVAGRPCDLRRREVQLLELLMRRSDKVVPRATIEEALYSIDEEIAPNTIDVLVSRLRKRLIAEEADVQIHTVRGVGYMVSGP